MLRGQQMRVVYAWLAIAGLAFVALRAPLLALPLERDEGEYATVAWRMQQGDVPYRDAFDQKPPGVFAAYWLAFEIFGREAVAPRLLLHAFSVATALLLFLLVRDLGGPAAAAGAVLVFAVSGADPRIGAATANTEAFLLLPMVAALLAALRAARDGGAAGWVVAGACSALAVSFKQVAATNALYVCVLALVLQGETTRTVRAAALAVGAALVVAPLVGVFVALGAGDAFYDAVIGHNLAYASRRTFEEGLAALAHGLGAQLPSFAAVWALAAWGMARRDPASMPGRRLAAGWLLASAAGVAIGWQFRPHYFVQALPALAACAGLGMAALVRALPRGGPVAAAALGAALVAVPYVANRPVLAAESSHAAARELWGLNPFPEAREIASHIARTTAPDESVFVVGSEPQIFFYAERPSATRYIFFYPLTGGYASASERQREALAEVARARPRYVVWVDVAASLLVRAETDRSIFDETWRLLARDYAPEIVAHPDADGEDYVWVRGAAARRWLEQEGRPLGTLPWVGVFRRTH